MPVDSFARATSGTPFGDGINDLDYAAFKTFLDQSYTPEQVSQELGITAGEIRRVAHRFATSKATTSL